MIRGSVCGSQMRTAALLLTSNLNLVPPVVCASGARISLKILLTSQPRPQPKRMYGTRFPLVTADPCMPQAAVQCALPRAAAHLPAASCI